MSFTRSSQAESVQNGEPAEVVLASAEATFTYAGRLEDGTQVVRDSNGLLHALVAIKRACSPD